MIRQGRVEPGCADCRRQFRPDRRSFLKAGLLGSTGISLAELLRHETRATESATAARNTSVIILWMRGGPSHEWHVDLT
jgi:hypothetical protein